MNTEKTSTGKMRAYFKAQNIEFSAKRIFIDGLGGMAYGLFASLLIGTIISTVGTYLFDLRFTLWGNEYRLLRMQTALPRRCRAQPWLRPSAMP